MSETLSDEDLNRFAAQLGAVRPSLGEGLGAALETGFEGTTLGSIATLGREVQGARRDPTPLTREEWQASGLARERMTYQEGMTRGQAEAMALSFDRQQARNRVMQARDPGALETAFQFGAQLAGNIPDPAILLPFVGVARLGLGAARGATAGAALLAESPALARASGVLASGAEALAGRGIGAGVARGVVDATLGNLAVAPLIYGVQERYGEDVTFGTVLRDLSIGALIGAGFGAAAGALGRGSDPRTAVRVLDAVAGDLAAGRAGEVPMPLVRASVEDAVMRSAPVDLQGVRLADLPAMPDGAPVSRAEFGAMVEQARRTRPVTLDDLEARDTAEARGGAQAASVEELLDFYKSGARPRGEKSLTQFVVEQGGIRDERGDVVNMMGQGSRTRPGLLNNTRGLPVDEMAEKARLAGYFPEFGGREGDGSAVGVDGFGLRPFLEALDEDLNKSRPRFGETEDVRGREMQAALADLDEALRAQGIDITAPRAEILRALRSLREDAPGRTLDDLVRDEEAYAWYREALAARQHMDRMAAAPAVRDQTDTGIPVTEQNQAVRPGAEDPDLTTALRQIDALRAEGRISPADDAILRAGADQADEIEAAANGLQEAGECLLRNLA